MDLVKLCWGLTLPFLNESPKQQRRHEQELFSFGQRQRGGGASLRGADAAEVCSHVGSIVDDGVFECSALAQPPNNKLPPNPAPPLLCKPLRLCSPHRRPLLKLNAADCEHCTH